MLLCVSESCVVYALGAVLTVDFGSCFEFLEIYTPCLKKSSTSYFAEYFRAGLTDCKNFNGYRVRDNLGTHKCIINVLIFNVPKCCHLAN